MSTLIHSCNRSKCKLQHAEAQLNSVMNINRVNCFDRPLQFRVCHSGSPAKGANGNIRARLNIIPEVISKDERKEYVNDHCEEKKNGPLISVTPEIEAAPCVPLPCLLCLPCPVIIGAHHHVACHSKFDKDGILSKEAT